MYLEAIKVDTKRGDTLVLTIIVHINMSAGSHRIIIWDAGKLCSG
jgi:hypothetical protein